MRDKPIIPVISIALVAIAMTVIHFIAIGFDPALSVLVVFVIAGLIILVLFEEQDEAK